MTGVSERLDAIEYRLVRAAPGAVTITPSDVAYLLDLARKQQAAIDRAEAIASEYMADYNSGIEIHYADLETLRAAIRNALEGQMSDMADVLRRHWSASTHTGRKPFVDKCDGCGMVIFSWGDPTVADGSERLAAHQAAALSAAGFGPVQEAKREAWDEGYTTGNAHNGRRDANPYRRTRNDDQ